MRLRDIFMTPTFFVEKLEYLVSKPSIFSGRFPCEYAFYGEGCEGVSSTAEGLGRQILGIELIKNRDIFVTPNLRDPERRYVQGDTGIISGIPLSTKELRKVMLGYQEARSKYYSEKDLIPKKTVQSSV